MDLLWVCVQPDAPLGSLGSLGGGPDLGQGEGLAMVPQGVVLQLTNGGRGEGAGQALVGIFTCKEKEAEQSVW